MEKVSRSRARVVGAGKRAYERERERDSRWCDGACLEKLLSCAIERGNTSAACDRYFKLGIIIIINIISDLAASSPALSVFYGGACQRLIGKICVFLLLCTLFRLLQSCPAPVSTFFTLPVHLVYVFVAIFNLAVYLWRFPCSVFPFFRTNF